MKLKYLGTAASEGWPAIFCQCDACKEARRRGGRHIRTRSQALINDDLLVDFPADSFVHMQTYNLDFGRINNVIVTHSHSDHFYPADFEMRSMPFAIGLKNYDLNIYGNDGVMKLFNEQFPKDVLPERREILKLHEVKAYDVFKVGDYTVTAFPAQHMKTEQALIYLIEKDGKAIFYGNDTGAVYDEVIEWLANNKKHIDLLSLDCTKCDIPADYDSHMGLSDCVTIKEKLTKLGVLDEKSTTVVTHFSHNGKTLYDELCEVTKPLGIIVAYDGMEVEF